MQSGKNSTEINLFTFGTEKSIFIVNLNYRYSAGLSKRSVSKISLKNKRYNVIKISTILPIVKVGIFITTPVYNTQFNLNRFSQGVSQAWDDTFINWESTTKHLSQFPKQKCDEAQQSDTFHRMGKRRASHHRWLKVTSRYKTNLYNDSNCEVGLMYISHLVASMACKKELLYKRLTRK